MAKDSVLPKLSAPVGTIIDGKLRPEVHRQPEPPPSLEVFEERVMAADCPGVVVVERTFIRALLRYVRRLERDVAEGGF